MSETTDRVRESRNQYQREWRKKNPDKVKAAQERYWVNRLNRQEAKQQKEGEQDD